MWHMASRRYTPDHHIVTTDIQSPVPPSHQGLYPRIKEIKCLVFVDRRWHFYKVSVCCKLLTSCMLLKRSKEMKSSNWQPVLWLQLEKYATPFLQPSSTVISISLHSFLRSTWLARNLTGTDRKQDVSPLLQTLETDLFHARIQA